MIFNKISNYIELFIFLVVDYFIGHGEIYKVEGLFTMIFFVLYDQAYDRMDFNGRNNHF
jgi:hypothetical protein